MTPADMFAMLQEIEDKSKGVIWALNDVSEIKKIDETIVSYTAKVGNWAVIIIRYNSKSANTDLPACWAYEGTAANAVSAVILRLTPELTEKLFNAALTSAN
jgi:hypothetical protein